MSSAPHRPAPAIRDHETIRMIGRGAFGEVWMARSVTGALRAVKVIWREDYDHPEVFEREFEAIKRYEPISRKHPGLVPVLQVGRSDTEGFYYYVMELADDLESGREIDPDTYKPHTLTAQMRRDKRIQATKCLELGSNIAEGLHYLHQNKLIHRDVKPSNLIFIDGQCRLADIGLVALLGQRTFVGTEGFVAPEGPGTPASDIFSLGMVLYEASTGKDRLDFPDLPSYRETGVKLQDWRRLHDVICRACAPKAGQRYDSAREMGLALRGEVLPSARRKKLIVTAAVAALCFTGIGMWIAHQRAPGGIMSVESKPIAPPLVIRTTPPGAVVFAGPDQLGQTPLDVFPPEDVPVIYQIRLQGYKHYELEHTSKAGKPLTMDIPLEKSRLPQAGERWKNSLGMEFVPRQGGHASQHPVEMSYFRKFVESSGRAFEGKVVRYQDGNDAVYIVVVPTRDADAFRYWLTDRDRVDGLLSQEHQYIVEPFYYAENQSNDEQSESRDENDTNDAEKDWQAFNLKVERQTYGTVAIKTVPEGVKVYLQDEFLGETPLEVPRVRSGPVEFELRKESFTDLLLEGDVKGGEILELYADMDPKTGVTYGREWRNSLGMKFVPLGDVLFAVWETRRRDYIEFCKETGRKRPPMTDDSSGKNVGAPVVSVSRDDARDFCAWLTKQQQAAKLIGPDDEYRLPTDEEWSRAVSLPLERGSTPAERSGRIRGIYPWGFEWPPPPGMANLADLEAAKKAGLDSVIPGYIDNFPFTAPVAAGQPNDRGIFALGGNISEWVDTDFDAKPQATEPPSKEKSNVLGTARGANWRTSSPEEALSSTRFPVPPDTRRNTLGFRVVVSRKPLE
ncbi:MAG: SUMF1/EgtB/PvdO family nonheme iron enzyme [Verrucomicrobiaceae bacterium]|nr:SUMF1/EgtB/PvdO family nonheme iron enzyme [Verrucomicrobiaceae bacterium]